MRRHGLRANATVIGKRVDVRPISVRQHEGDWRQRRTYRITVCWPDPEGRECRGERDVVRIYDDVAVGDIVPIWYWSDDARPPSGPRFAFADEPSWDGGVVFGCLSSAAFAAAGVTVIVLSACGALG